MLAGRVARRDRSATSFDPGKESIESTGGIREDRDSVVDGAAKWRSPTIPEPFFSLRQRGITGKKKGAGGTCVCARVRRVREGRS